MGKITQNSNGSWSTIVYLGREGDKNIRKSVTADTKQHCKQDAAELEHKNKLGQVNQYSSMKLSEYMDCWLHDNRGLLAPTTLKTYNLYARAHFRPYFKNVRVDKITDAMIRRYLSDKLEELSPTTVRKHYFTLSRMLGDALKGANPCIGIKAPQNAAFKPHVPTEDEFAAIVKAFGSISNEDEAIILLAGWCGLRRGEIFALKWDDINDQEDTIRIDEAMALEEDGYDFVEKDPKSRNGFRTIAIPKYLTELLADIKKNKHKFKRFKKYGGRLPDISNLAFQQDPHSFTKKYVRVIAEQKLPKVRFHDLRHYHASLLYKNNVPDQYAAERLGHDVWVLKRVYQHLGLKEEKELDDQVRDMFK
ncbi:MAG TPA: site-specific integrase [Clostridiaceae bacterium]